MYIKVHVAKLTDTSEKCVQIAVLLPRLMAFPKPVVLANVGNVYCILKYGLM